MTRRLTTPAPTRCPLDHSTVKVATNVRRRLPTARRCRWECARRSRTADRPYLAHITLIDLNHNRIRGFLLHRQPTGDHRRRRRRQTASSPAPPSPSPLPGHRCRVSRTHAGCRPLRRGSTCRRSHLLRTPAHFPTRSRRYPTQPGVRHRDPARRGPTPHAPRRHSPRQRVPRRATTHRVGPTGTVARTRWSSLRRS